MRFTRVLAKSTTVVVVAALTTLLGMTARAEEGDTTRVSVSSTGVEANDDSSVHAVSENGRFIAFESRATNLTASDTNGASDVFVHDRTTGETTRVSISGDGTPGNNDSFWPAISGDGRYVAFDSNATNLVPGDTNGVSDVFVHDRTTGETSRVSVDNDGTEGDDASSRPSISLDGRFIAFHSNASNLVSGDTNGVSDIFVHNWTNGRTSRVSTTSNGAEAAASSHDASISADGSEIVFVSWAGNLAPGDTNGVRDIFHHDRATGETTRISVHSNGTQGNDESSFPHISPEGGFVAFESDATNLVPGDTNETPDAFIHDLTSRETSRVSVASNGQQGDGGSTVARISRHGRYVAFTSEATNLAPGDTNGVFDAFVHDRTAGVTSRVSVNSNGGEDNGLSGSYSISPEGRYVGLISDATNLVPGDTNGVFDVFVHQYLPHENYFVDDDGHLFEDDINTIAWAGITRGCNPPDNDQYCPDESFLRGQAAAFMRRALDVTASDTDHFTDDDTSVFEGDINAIATEGITLGCNPPDNTLFCPTDPFTRGQAAAFVRRALNIPATATDHFVDDNDSVFEGDINAIAEAGITRGCNPPDNDRYCPHELLTRGQAAAFMRRALLP